MVALTRGEARKGARVPIDVPHEADCSFCDYLVGTRRYTVLDLAERVIRLAGSASEIRFEGLPRDDPQRRRPDIARARTRLGWEPRVSLDDGLPQTIAWFRTAVAEGTPAFATE